MRTDRLKALDKFVEKMSDPVWLAGRLMIVTKTGETRRLEPRFAEQRACAAAFRTHHNILVEKPRQIGSTTEWVALFTALMIVRGLQQRAYNVLAVMHANDNVVRFTQQVRHHLEFMPPELRPRVTFENTKEVAFRIGKTEAYFKATMAGGRGQGRSRTFQGVLLSEAGLYPRGSSAQGGRKGVDEEVYAAITSTMPTPDVEPWVRLVVESTCNGPSGLFHHLIQRTQTDAEVARAWAFLFFPWHKFEQYRMKWDPLDKVTADEAALLAQWSSGGMTIEHLAFRRFLIHKKGYTERMFRQEYPSSWDEPFLLTTLMWFNLERIAQLTKLAPSGGQIEGLRVYHKFSAGHMYYLGVDAAGGTGGDNAVIAVIRDDGELAAIWSSNNKSPREQGDETSKLSLTYGGAIANVEVGNVWGRAVWKRARELGTPLWYDEEGREFVTDKRTKAAVMDWMRHLIERGFAKPLDRTLLDECTHVREQANGTIGADQGYHDDHVMATALALWAARASLLGGWRPPPPSSTMTWRREDVTDDPAYLEQKMTGSKRWTQK